MAVRQGIPNWVRASYILRASRLGCWRVSDKAVLGRSVRVTSVANAKIALALGRSTGHQDKLAPRQLNITAAHRQFTAAHGHFTGLPMGSVPCNWLGYPPRNANNLRRREFNKCPFSPRWQSF